MDASVNRISSAADQRALLVAVQQSADDPEEVRDSLDELTLLVATAGAIVVDTMVVKRASFDPAYLIGVGVLDRIKSINADCSIRLVVVDLNTIKPAQVRNLEEYLGCRVVGRTEIILDIFARRARSAESKIQVELAQLRYILPRLKGLGGVLSRLGGGIGTRGPGEKMLETDRRHIIRRISALKKKLYKISRHRQLVRKSRDRAFRGAVVGYTNAGKSTLINRLAKDDLFVEDRLFATLDSFTRTVYINDDTTILLTDTVGFIRNLPANLIESFQSTLEEIRHADFLVHVVDCTARSITGNRETVERELARLEAFDKPVLLFFNKADAATPEAIERIMIAHPSALVGSAATGSGIDALRCALLDLSERRRKFNRAG